MVVTKMQNLCELTSQLKDDFSFLEQKIGFVHKSDRLVLSMCGALCGIMKTREDRPLASSLVQKQHTHQKDSPHF